MERGLTDVHTHSLFSADGKSELADMVKTAFERGVAFYGVAEHFDYDYLVDGIPFSPNCTGKFTDAEGYFAAGRKLQAEYAGRMELLLGGEFGYTDNPKAWGMYRALIEKYRPDFVVNSVHAQGVSDYSQKTAFYLGARQGESAESIAQKPLRGKREVFGEYFSLVRRSVDAPYDFDIVAHMAYVTRYAPYENKLATVEEFGGEIDGILMAIIQRNKILEVNTSSYGLPAPHDFVPDLDVLARYYALGGRKVSFGSDAHRIDRIMDKRPRVVEALKAIGFTFLTVPKGGAHIEVAL